MKRMGCMFHKLEKNRSIFVLIAVLSIMVGIEYLLPIDGHMEGSYMWGVSFLVMRIFQMTYGIIESIQ